jgi:glycosyltransferase involved in cell wall biosynthesis
MSETVPLFSLVYTSARPASIPEVVKYWDGQAKLHNHEWIIAVDAGDDKSKAAAEAALAGHGKIVINEGDKNCVTGWNLAAKHSTGKIIVAVADDFAPPTNWDEGLLAAGPAGWEAGDHVVHTEDGYVHDIFVLSILTRQRYEKFGYVFYPKYQSIFCDTEFTEVAKRDAVVIEAKHLLFEHMHPDCNKRARDAVDFVHSSSDRWNTGEMLFKFRQARNFPLDDGPKAVVETAPVTQAAANESYVAYMQVTKDDLCLLDVCRRLNEEGVKDFCFAQPDYYWSGEPVELHYTVEVNKIADQLRKEGLTVHQRMFHVEHFKLSGDSRIAVETRLRNESLSWIRSLGYKHILVVDGDELWIKGTLSLIKTYVEQGHKAVSVRMMPVIGLPGYPVDFAQDLAVVYVGGDVTFKCCRSPYINQTIIPRPLIYHFTGTRKDMDETIKKHRRGGHYDDPEYDFETWIKDTLPNIKPGLKNAHMFKPRQIWPVVRAWRKNELEQMPESVRPFLGTDTL